MSERDDLEAAIGPHAVAALAGVFGERCYIPQRVPDESIIARLLGRILADRLAAAFGGSEVRLPRFPVAAARIAFVRELCAAGYTHSEISRRVGLSCDYVRRLIADGKKPGLIDDLARATLVATPTRAPGKESS